MNRPGDIFITLAVICTAALSCAKENTESILYSDVPVSFSAFGSWDEATETTKTAVSGNATEFTAGDRIGVFAYHNDSSKPDFMNDQPVLYSGTAWGYSPRKYWPADQDGHLSFYAYWPYSEDSHGSIRMDGNGGAPALSYSNPEADIDLMVAAATNLTYATSPDAVHLEFSHLLAKVNFAFTYEGDDGYRPVVHVLKYNIPHYEAVYNYKSNSWEDLDHTCTVVRHTAPEGVSIHDKGQIIPSFEAYLLPGGFPSSDGMTPGDFIISLNNIEYRYTTKELVSLESGKRYTINFKIKAKTGGNYFITSFSMWEKGDKEWNADLK